MLWGAFVESSAGLNPAHSGLVSLDSRTQYTNEKLGSGDVAAPPCEGLFRRLVRAVLLLELVDARVRQVRDLCEKQKVI